MTGEHQHELSPEEEQTLHERWIAELEQQWAPLLEMCPDAVYFYIDDEHKTCNQAAADLYGMTIEHFKAMESYLDECVAEEDIDLVIHHYFEHFEQEVRPTTFDFTGLRQDGTRFPATAFNIPIVHDGKLMLLAFVRLRPG